LLTNYLRNDDNPADINDLDLGGDGFVRETFDELLGVDSSDLTLQQIGFYRPLVYQRMAEESRDMLFLKVHDFYEKNSRNQPIFSAKATAGVIYLIRNPLDVAVSFAHHRNRSIKNTIKFMGNEEASLTDLISSGPHLPQKLESWSSHVKSWADEPNLNILTVRYEDMLADTFKSFAEIIKFAGLERDEMRIKKAVEFSKFKRLKQQEKEHGFREKQRDSESFFRQGKSGGWREKLDDSQIEQIINDHSEVMKRFGYLDENKRIFG
jgi:hypothetical protein